MNVLKVEDSEHKENCYVDPEYRVYDVVMWIETTQRAQTPETLSFLILRVSIIQSTSTSSNILDFYFKSISRRQFLPGSAFL